MTAVKETPSSNYLPQATEIVISVAMGKPLGAGGRPSGTRDKKCKYWRFNPWAGGPVREPVKPMKEPMKFGNAMLLNKWGKGQTLGWLIVNHVE